MSKRNDIKAKQFHRQESMPHLHQRQIADELLAEGKEAVQNKNQNTKNN